MNYNRSRIEGDNLHVKEYINIQWIRILLACLIGMAFVYGYDVLGIGLLLCSYGLYFMVQEEGGID